MCSYNNQKLNVAAIYVSSQYIAITSKIQKAIISNFVYCDNTTYVASYTP